MGLNDLELATLLCSRVCHDVISPVGAIGNGLEILAEEEDEEMRRMAFDLVKRSAEQASAKLQFCRLAFGAAAAAGATIDLGEAGEIARNFVGDEKVKLDWAMPREGREKTAVKLVLNLMLMGLSAIPRGGTVTVGQDGERLVVRAAGTAAKLPDKSRDMLAGSVHGAEIDARLVQVYYAMRLAGEAGYQLAATAEGDEVVISAAPGPAA